MKVRLLHNYRGRMSNEQVITAGVYSDSEHPQALLQYWVTNGHAELIDKPIAPVADSEPVARPKRKSFGD